MPQQEAQLGTLCRRQILRAEPLLDRGDRTFVVTTRDLVAGLVQQTLSLARKSLGHEVATQCQESEKSGSEPVGVSAHGLSVGWSRGKVIGPEQWAA